MKLPLYSDDAVAESGELSFVGMKKKKKKPVSLHTDHMMLSESFDLQTASLVRWCEIYGVMWFQVETDENGDAGEDLSGKDCWISVYDALWRKMS